MLRKATAQIIGSGLVAIVLFLLLRHEDVLDIHAIDESKIEHFDLILSKGQSLSSKLVSFLKLSTDDYAHIGMLVKEKGGLFVLHATPDGTRANGLRYDSLEAFLALSHVRACKILRHQGLTDDHRVALMNEIERYKSIQRPFDYDFDNVSHDKIYCSELIWLIFRNAGLMDENMIDLESPIYPTCFQDMKAFASIQDATCSP